MFTRLGKIENAAGILNLNSLRTHPTSDNRIKVRLSYHRHYSPIFSDVFLQALESMLPEAYAVQAESPECGGVRDSLAAFREVFAHAPWSSPDDGDMGAFRRWS